VTQNKDDVRPPVEPMSDVTWARVERGLWSRLDGATPVPAARSRRWWWIAVPSIAAAAVIAIVFALAIDTPKPLPVAVVPVEAPPTRIESHAAPTTATVGDAYVTLDPESVVVMARPGDSTTVLERGAAWFDIAPRTGRPFVVLAGDTIVRVIGTKFRVARFAERVEVEVERGLVDVTFRGATAQLGAGQRWSSETPSKDAPIIDKKPPKPTDRANFERAQALEVRDPNAAIALYLEVSRGTSAWALTSLYAAGRLAADRGEPRAKTLLEMYLRRAPRGANADDARIMLDRLKGAP
jgi:FecR protein